MKTLRVDDVSVVGDIWWAAAGRWHFFAALLQSLVRWSRRLQREWAAPAGVVMLQMEDNAAFKSP